MLGPRIPTPEEEDEELDEECQDEIIESMHNEDDSEED